MRIEQFLSSPEQPEFGEENFEEDIWEFDDAAAAVIQELSVKSVSWAVPDITGTFDGSYNYL